MSYLAIHDTSHCYNLLDIIYHEISKVKNMAKIHIILLILKIYKLHNYKIKSFFYHLDILLKMVPKFNEIAI
jgi:hypothetical protein